MTIRDEVGKKLAALAQGETTPELASEWALATMEGSDEDLRDRNVWNALDGLGGADLMTGPGAYLHDSEDFTNWLTEYSESQRTE